LRTGAFSTGQILSVSAPFPAFIIVRFLGNQKSLIFNFFVLKVSEAYPIEDDKWQGRR
jgi:hypothetical protein